MICLVWLSLRSFAMLHSLYRHTAMRRVPRNFSQLMLQARAAVRSGCSKWELQKKSSCIRASGEFRGVIGASLVAAVTRIAFKERVCVSECNVNMRTRVYSRRREISLVLALLTLSIFIQVGKTVRAFYNEGIHSIYLYPIPIWPTRFAVDTSTVSGETLLSGFLASLYIFY